MKIHIWQVWPMRDFIQYFHYHFLNVETKCGPREVKHLLGLLLIIYYLLAIYEIDQPNIFP